MKRDREAEGKEILREAEESLREVLLDWLPHVELTGEALFSNSRFNPHGLPAHALSKKAEALLEAASNCVELRDALELPTAGSIGEQFLEACAENASANEHRRGPRRLASALLQELKIGGSQ